MLPEREKDKARSVVEGTSRWENVSSVSRKHAHGGRGNQNEEDTWNSRRTPVKRCVPGMNVGWVYAS
jgi:hypothetical protein